MRRKPIDREQQWRVLSDEVISGVTEWRLQHPRATFKEIEAAIDERLAKMRARMLQDVAVASERADWREAAAAEQPRCAECGERLSASGSHTRQIQTQGGEAIGLSRTYGVCPACGAGFFRPR